jgi:uncharacterized protein with HEPN domain
VSESYKQKHKEIPWKSMVGLRNILAHEYGEVKEHLIHLPLASYRIHGVED